MTRFPQKTPWYRRLLAHSVFGACLLAGCLLGQVGKETVRPDGNRNVPDFPHLVHIEDEGFDCVDCHRTVEEEAEAGMPELKGCALCHEDIDPDLPPERRASAFEVDGKAAWGYRARLGGDLKFSHTVHLGAELPCSGCHGDIEANEVLTDEVRLDMDDCVDCHTKKGSGVSCETCHEEIRADVRPASHGSTWTRLHGEIARSDRADDPRFRCAQCHTQSACDSCHLTEPPRNHTTLWRRRGHGVAAAFERDRCVTCHQTDACASCHENTRPMSHVSAWSTEPAYLHCSEGCHLTSASGAGCTMCHRSLQAHADAPVLTGTGLLPPHPMPMGGMRCTMCHEY